MKVAFLLLNKIKVVQMQNLTQSLLKQLLHYDPETGVWTWLAPYSRNIKPGDMAGSDGGRYWRIQINGRSYGAGRLAWLYMTGQWPKEQIDHIDRNGYNDRWINLREATSSQNNFNRYDGIRGVNKQGNKYRATVGLVFLGLYDTFEEASAVRDEAAKDLGGEFAKLNSDMLSA